MTLICEACEEDDGRPTCEGCDCCQECCNCTEMDCDCEACVDRRENEDLEARPSDDPYDMLTDRQQAAEYHADEEQGWYWGTKGRPVAT